MGSFMFRPGSTEVGMYNSNKRIKGRFPLPEFTGRVDGPRTRVHFLTPVNSGRELG